MGGMKSADMQGILSRRQFVKSTAVYVAALSARNLSVAQATSQDGPIAYVGTYTGAIGAGSNGEGIYRFRMNASTGALSDRKLVAKSPNPSWIAIHPSKKYLYAVNEVSDYQGNSGSVSAFSIDPSGGDLAPLNVVSSEGAGPCYLSIDATGNYAFVANYGGGTVVVLPILASGKLGAATDMHRDSGDLGATAASDAPNGSFAVSGHDGPHAHMIAPAPRGKFVLATDLGQDRIYTYQWDGAAGKLMTANGAPFVTLPSGNGPRHFVFHPNGHWLYVIQEESSTVALLDYNAETGALTSRQSISTLPRDFAGTSFASEILIAPNGKDLYAANRLHDSISVFSIGADGRLTWMNESPTLGDYPGQCRLDPSGKFLYACNRRSDDITCFRIHPESGLLTFTGQYTPVGSPGSITFMS
jgi:6-phosphogluconolactonase (cycloisomerase 2 family)